MYAHSISQLCRYRRAVSTERPDQGFCRKERLQAPGGAASAGLEGAGLQQGSLQCPEVPQMRGRATCTFEWAGTVTVCDPQNTLMCTHDQGGRGRPSSSSETRRDAAPAGTENKHSGEGGLSGVSHTH